jgi:alkylation response protein AidB-like acyl-CoA dehydrogenase
MTTVERAQALLTDEMLARFDERAPMYDRENRFFDEDFAELKESGYLLVAVPEELGGSGLKLDEVVKLQQRLAYYAGPTAIAVNMHIYWTGLAADLLRAGDDSCKWILEEAAAGKIFAAIHGEAGNDMPLLYSTATAEPVDGGWEISWHKIFGSLSPVWDYGGFHAQDNSDPDNPKIVHGFLPRDTKGVDIVDTWDTLGMRATQSHDTILDKAFCPAELVPMVSATGFAGAAPFHLEVFAWALMGFAAVYLGQAQRAFDLTVARVPQRTSLALNRSMAWHPEVLHNVAEMRMTLDQSGALLEQTTRDWANGAEHEDWPVRLVGTRYKVISNAYDVVDRAMELSGGAAAFKRNRLEQIFRDARMGRFHPGHSFLAHELLGKLCLGLNPDEQPRWG